MSFKNLVDTLCIILLLTICQSVDAQISGISGNKISSFSYDPIPFKKVEFEPTFSTTFTTDVWTDQDVVIDSLPNVSISSNMYWRVTYGLNKRTELGLSAPNNLNTINLAAKVWLTENAEYYNNQYKHLSYSLLGYGIVSSFQLNPKNQIDVNLQVQHGFNDLNPNQLYLNADFGSYFLRDDLFIIIGAGYQQNLDSENPSNKFTIYPGFALETGKQFLFVINSQHDLFGRNNTKTWGLNVALTTGIF